MAKHGGFPGMGMGGNLQNLARQAQKLQQQMTEKQQELEARQFEASAGGGMVTAVVTGKKQLAALTIKPEAVDPDDVEMLQDMIRIPALRRRNDHTNTWRKSFARLLLYWNWRV